MNSSEIYDIDVRNHHSWQEMLKMITRLCDDSADCTFSCRNADGWKIPTLEVRLDRPDELEEPERQAAGKYKADVWKNKTVIFADDVPEKIPDGEVFLLRENGAAAVTYRAFREIIRVMRKVKEKPEFLWSSVPLSPVCDTVSVTFEKEKKMYSCGAVHTLWVRGRDEDIRGELQLITGCGELRVQNMATANTWITGSTEDTELLKVIKAQKY